MHNSRKGFTLAEVLVTLAIIGVVAALTIPTLIQSTANDKFKVALKKDIGVLNGALMSYNADGTSLSASNSTTGTLLANVFATKLNVLKNDGAGTLWLADGTKVGFFGLAATGCEDSITNPDNIAGNLATHCFAIIDVNGDKLPNKVSTGTDVADVYVVGISKNTILPLGTVTTATPVTSLAAQAAGFLNDASNTPISPVYVQAAPGNAALNVLTGGTT